MSNEAELLAELLREERDRNRELEREVAVLRARASEDDEPEWLTLQEAADLLGIHYQTLWRAASSGNLSGATKVGGSYRVSRSALLRSRVPKPGTSRRPRKKRGRHDSQKEDVDEPRQHHI